MKSREMSAYVPVVHKMADTAIAFLAEQGLCFPDAYPMPELRLSLERRVKLHGIYNKHNVLAELRRLQAGFGKELKVSTDKGPLLLALSFLDKMALFLSGSNVDISGLSVWLRLEQEFDVLEGSFLIKPDSNVLGSRIKLWQQLVRLYAKVQQLKISQQLSGVFSSEGRITLYMSNIEAICREQNLEINAYLQSVLVHEYTHACHYALFMEAQLKSDQEQYAPERAVLRWSGAYFSKQKVAAVKESLARYVQLLWCRLNEPALVEGLRSGEYGEYVICPNWPYAGAQTLLSLSRAEAEKLFVDIWQASLVDWKQAYRLLGPESNMVK